MSDTLSIPPAQEIARRIEANRREIAALKKLHRAAKAAEEVAKAQQQREAAAR